MHKSRSAVRLERYRGRHGLGARMTSTIRGFFLRQRRIAWTAKDDMRESRNVATFLSRTSGHDRCYRALRPIRLCEAPAGPSFFSQRVRTDALYEHSGVHAASNRQFIFQCCDLHENPFPISHHHHLLHHHWLKFPVLLACFVRDPRIHRLSPQGQRWRREVIALPEAEKDSDVLRRASVKRFLKGVVHCGIVEDIEQGKDSSERLNLIRYTDGDTEHLTADQGRELSYTAEDDASATQEQVPAASPARTGSVAKTAV